ncbi:MAG TPA: YqaA family protein [Acidobacteriota bacterium]|nr:YqaA family protein [Acidobacteriota bacterium]
MIAVLQAPFRWSRRLYDWVLSWGTSRHGQSALFILSAAEASFFPVPPDALLIALCMGAHKRWARFALVCSVGSLIGGMLGYLIGFAAFDLIGHKLLSLAAWLSGVDADQLLQTAMYWFNEKEIWGARVGAWAVGIAGFTPVPYKVFTIAAGFFKMSFAVFVAASAISRSLRFFIVAGLIGILFDKYGERIRSFIDKYFNLLAVAFVVLLVLGFMSLGFLRGD